MILPLLCIFFAQALSAPFRSTDLDLNAFFNFSTCTNLVSTPSGKLAWVETLVGTPNIFLFDPKQQHTIQLTSYTQDEGLEITRLCFDSDEQKIFYSLSPIEGANSKSLRVPNVGQILVVGPNLPPIGITSDGSVLLTCQHSIVTILSPSGLRISTIKFSNGKPNPSHPLLQLQDGNFQGSIGMATWNADDTCLAFDNFRGDHSFVGVLCSHNPSVQWLASSFHFNQNPVWSPDGNSVAFFQLRPQRNQMGVITKYPFKVMYTQLGTEQTVTVFTDKVFGFPDAGFSL